MRFLIDANLPRSLATLLRNFGHDSIDVRDVGLGNAQDSEIAAYARQNVLCLISRDYDFADIRIYPPKEYAGIVILGVRPNATYHDILELTKEFLQHSDIIDAIIGQLAIVEPGRIRLRSE